MHTQIQQSLALSSSTVFALPSCYRFVSDGDDQWWSAQLQNFPEQYQVPCNALVTERIPPFPTNVRDFLIERYCPKFSAHQIEILKSSEGNQDCLIRPYLGRMRRLEQHSKSKFFSLRNYPLHLDQIEELELDAMKYAKIMADALAHLYWRAHIDANDVEFVLAPPRSDHQSHQAGKTPAHPSIIESEILGPHAIWILDFDCCRQMALSEEGVAQAVAAFYKNDRFFPRPGRERVEDQQLWGHFKDQFTRASGEILRPGEPEACLPALWVSLVEQQNQPRCKT